MMDVSGCLDEDSTDGASPWPSLWVHSKHAVQNISSFNLDIIEKC